jgi:large subunit ribosomal protein L14
MLTKLKIIDNSGAIIGRIIKILNKKSSLAVGTLVLVSVQKNIPHAKIRKGDTVKAIVVNGSYNNLVSVINTTKSLILVKLAPKGKEYLPLGTRIKGPVSSALRNINGMQRITSLSKRTL